MVAKRVPRDIGDINGLAAALAATATDADLAAGLATKASLADVTAALAGISAPRAQHGLVNAPCVVRNPVYPQYAGFDASSTAINLIYGFIPAINAQDIRIVYVGPTTGGPITVRASYEPASGTYYPFYFRGNRDGVIGAGGILVSDPLPVEITAAVGNQFFRTRTYATAPSGTTWPCGNTNTAPGFGYNNTASDMTTSGGDFTAGASTYVWGPSYIIGTPTDNDGKVIGGIGDSIWAGQGDQNTSPGQGTVAGPFLRAMANRGGIVVAHSGDTIANFAQLSNRIVKMSLLTGCTHVISEYGVNDITPSTLEATKSNVLAVAKLFVDRGIKFYPCTVSPAASSNVDSTDPNWFAPSTQTDSTSGAIAAYNQWLRSGPSALFAGYMECAYPVESSPNSGKWKQGYQEQKVAAANVVFKHPGLLGHAAMAGGIDLSKLT